MTDPPSVTRAEISDLEERARLATFGQLLDLARRGGPVSADLMRDLAIAKQHRNALSHGYFARRAAEFCFTRGCKDMHRELQDFQAHLNAVVEQTHSLVAGLVANQGLTVESLMAEARQLLREAAAHPGGQD